MIKQLCKNCWQNVILYQICCVHGQVLPLRDSAHFVRPRVCSANYPIIDFFWQDFVLQKIVRVRIPCCLINKKIKGIANAIPFILGGEWGIRTLGPVRDYLISSQARYDHFDNSPYSIYWAQQRAYIFYQTYIPLSNDLFKYFNLVQSIRVLCLRKTDLHGKIHQCLRKSGD